MPDGNGRRDQPEHAGGRRNTPVAARTDGPRRALVPLSPSAARVPVPTTESAVRRRGRGAASPSVPVVRVTGTLDRCRQACDRRGRYRRGHQADRQLRDGTRQERGPAPPAWLATPFPCRPDARADRRQAGDRLGYGTRNAFRRSAGHARGDGTRTGRRPATRTYKNPLGGTGD